MIERACTLRKPIDQFYGTWEENDKDKLTEDDWDIIEKVGIRTSINIGIKLLTKHYQYKAFLSQLDQTLMALQSSTSTLDNVLPAMDFILEMFEDGKERFKDSDFLAPCINSAWSKLNKYYTKTSESPAYISALVLHPAFKWEYIEATWDPEWIPKSREQVEELWKRYQPADAPEIISVSSGCSSQLKSNQFCDWKHKKQAAK
jgi:hypothetical protein